MTKSTFYHDGFAAGSNGYPCSPCAVPVYASEYRDGYRDGQAYADEDARLDALGNPEPC